MTGSSSSDMLRAEIEATGHVLYEIGWASDGPVAWAPTPWHLSSDPGRRTSSIDFAVNLPASATEYDADLGPDDQVHRLSVGYYGKRGVPEGLTFVFTPHAPTAPGDPPTNTWTMQITDTASDGAIVGEYALVFDDSRASGRTLVSVETVSGGSYDPVTGTLDLGVVGRPIELDIGVLGDPDGITQLSDSFAPTLIQKDGAASGLTGYCAIEYTVNGMAGTLYRIPLIALTGADGTIITADPEAIVPDPEVAGGAGLSSRLYLHGTAADETVVGGTGRQVVFGHRGMDILSGGGDDDRLFGGRGRDILSGDGGDDILGGGRGPDGLNGWTGNDEVRGGAGSDTVRGGVGNDRVFGGGGEDTLAGGDGDDSLFGDRGADVLFGNAGDDSLVGGRGGDRLYGGTGADVFVFRDGDSKPMAKDSINDFAPGKDLILLDIRTDGGNRVAFSGGEFSAAGPSFIVTDIPVPGGFDVDTRRGVVVRVDVDGDQVSDMEIAVWTVDALGAEDFLM